MYIVEDVLRNYHLRYYTQKMSYEVIWNKLHMYISYNFLKIEKSRRKKLLKTQANVHLYLENEMKRIAGRGWNGNVARGNRKGKVEYMSEIVRQSRSWRALAN